MCDVCLVPAAAVCVCVCVASGPGEETTDEASSMMDPQPGKKKRKGGAEREREKKTKVLEDDAAKCLKLTNLFSPLSHCAIKKKQRVSASKLSKKKKHWFLSV